MKQLLSKNVYSSKTKQNRKRVRSFMPVSMRLEDRWMPSTISVLNLNDSGAGSLRTAIAAANDETNNPGADMIVFDSSLAGTINLATVANSTNGPTALLITSNITIDGVNGGTGITIKRLSSVSNLRLFQVDVGASLTLDGVTLQGGKITGFNAGDGGGYGGGGGGGAGLGGAVLNQGTLAVMRSLFRDNEAIGGNGGGVPNTALGGGGGGGLGGAGAAPSGSNGGTGGTNGGGLGGTAFGGSGTAGGFGGGGGGGAASLGQAGNGGLGGFGGGGGGAGVNGDLSLNGTPGLGGFGGGQGGDVQSNTAGVGGGGSGLGGGIFNWGGTLTITNSTFSTNKANGGSYGSISFAAGATNGSGFGGAVFNRNGTFNSINNTFSGNIANNGGGIYDLGDGAAVTTTVKNTILANSSGSAKDYFFNTINSGSVSSAYGNNVIEQHQSGLGGVFSTSDASLGTLQDNGGPSFTMAIPSKSNAYDTGNDSAAAGLATDQRGTGFTRFSGTVDIGAFELAIIVNKAPSGTDKTVTATEDTSFTFAASDFGFADPDDSPADNLLAVKITTLPGAGTLANNGNSVSANDFIPVVDITSGKLKFTPATDSNGASYATFTFQVQDDGGTAGTGVDLDQSANTITVDVTAVADITNDSLTTNEDLAVTANVITGTSGATADTFESGSAAITSVSQGANGAVTFLSTGSVTYTPDADFNGSDFFTYSVTSGGVTETATVSVIINPLNDAPVLVVALSDQTADSDAPFNVQFASNTFHDIDVGDSLTYTATLSNGSPLPVWLSFDGPNRTFSGTPAESDVAAFNVKVTATDTGVETATDTFQLTVRDKTAPVVTLTARSITNDSTPSVTVSATDGASSIVGATVTIDVDLNHSSVFGDFTGELGYSTSTLSSGTVTFDLSPALSDGTYGVRTQVSDAAANQGTSATQSVAVDTVNPTVTLVTAQTNPTNATSISYTVTFDEAVSNITTDDFDLTLAPVGGGSLTANVASVSASSVSASGSVTVVVNSIAGDGTLTLNLKSGTDITDAATNVVTAASSSAITIDQTKPAADIINVTSDPRESSVDSINVTFSEPVFNVDLNDFTLTRNGNSVTLPGTASLSGIAGSSIYSITGLSTLTNNEGAYVLTLLSSGTGITDAAGNEQDTGATDDWLFLSTSVTTSGVSPNETITITDIGGSTDDDVIIIRDPNNANNLLITVEGKTLTYPLGGVSNLIVNSGVGNDKLTLDFGNGALPFNLTFNGGTDGNDSLVIHNAGAYGLVDSTYASVNDGSLSFTGGASTRTVTYTGLEPVTIDGTPTGLIFNLPNTNDTDVTLSVVGGLLRLAGSTFEDTNFDPTGVTSITINGNGGNDGITIGDLGGYTGTLTVNGGAGNDVIDASAATIGVTLLGGGGNDSLTGSDFADSLGGDAGKDTLQAGVGDDTLSGGTGNDVLDGEGGTDSYAEIVTGSVTITNTKLIGGNFGLDVRISLESIEFSGDSGNNLLDASQYTLGAVTLRGLDGDDTLLGGATDDLLDGGNGIDVVKQTSGQNQILTGLQLTGNGFDTLTSIERANLTAKSALGNTVDASAFNGLVTLTGGTGPDLLLSSSVGGVINGGSGKDSITGSIGSDVIDGGTGDDAINGGDGLDTLFGGTGNDMLDGGVGEDVINGGEGRDKIFGGEGNDTIDGGIGDDTISGDNGNDTITGGIGNDAISGGDGRDFLDGQGGQDTLLGDAGNDTLRGGKGRDVCLGGEDHDNVDGGEERDTVAGGLGSDFLSSFAEIDEAFLFDFNTLLV